MNLLRDCFVLGIVLGSGTNIQRLLVGMEIPRSWGYSGNEIIKVLRKLTSWRQRTENTLEGKTNKQAGVR